MADSWDSAADSSGRTDTEKRPGSRGNDRNEMAGAGAALLVIARGARWVFTHRGGRPHPDPEYG